MMAADAIRDVITPVLSGWRVQFGAWRDGAKTDRYAVIRPVGGLPAELVRQPQFVLSMIGALNDDASIPAEAMHQVIETMRTTSGAITFMQPAEPVFVPTNDGRPVFELAVSAITT